MKKKALVQREIPTLISVGCTIEGTINASSIVRIDGKVFGNVTVEEGLVVGEGGLVQGDVFTKELVVYGTITGNVSTTSVEVKSSGAIHGDMRTNHILIESGGFFNGAMVMEKSSGNRE